MKVLQTPVNWAEYQKILYFPDLSFILLQTLLACVLERMLILETDKSDFEFRLCQLIRLGNLLKLSKMPFPHLKHKDKNNTTLSTKPW